MNNHGFASTMALCVVAFLALLGATFFTVLRIKRANAQARLFEVRSFFIAHSAALIAFHHQFSQDSLSFEFEGGHVSMERLEFTPDKSVTIRCLVNIGPYHRQSDIDWKKFGEHWRAVSWREM